MQDATDNRCFYCGGPLPSPFNYCPQGERGSECSAIPLPPTPDPPAAVPAAEPLDLDATTRINSPTSEQVAMALVETLKIRLAAMTREILALRLALAASEREVRGRIAGEIEAAASIEKAKANSVSMDDEGGGDWFIAKQSRANGLLQAACLARGGDAPGGGVEGEGT